MQDQFSDESVNVDLKTIEISNALDNSNLLPSLRVRNGECEQAINCGIDDREFVGGGMERALVDGDACVCGLSINGK